MTCAPFKPSFDLGAAIQHVARHSAQPSATISPSTRGHSLNYRKLGRTNFEVQRHFPRPLGHGGWSESDDHQSLEALQLAVDQGGNFFDSAWAYGDGKSDSLLGQILANNPDKSSTPPPKSRPRTASGPPRQNINIRMSFPRITYSNTRTKSAKSWAPKPSTFSNSTYGTTPGRKNRNSAPRSKAKERENHPCLRPQSQPLAASQRDPRLAHRPGRRSPGHLQHLRPIPEDELFPVCQELNIGVIARVPLDEGSLGGKMTLETRFPDTDWRSKYFGPRTSATPSPAWRNSSTSSRGMTLPQMVSRFILSHPAVSTTIVGMRKPEHVAKTSP